MTSPSALERPSPTTSSNPLPSIDHQYFRKIVHDLQLLKETLIAKEVELERERSGNGQGDVQLDGQTARLRTELTSKAANLTLLQAEEQSISSMIKKLKMERDTWIMHGTRIAREVDARLAIKQIDGVGGGSTTADAEQKSEVEKSLLQVKEWIDEVVDKWDEVSQLVFIAEPVNVS